jgi:hypothetical protein
VVSFDRGAFHHDQISGIPSIGGSLRPGRKGNHDLDRHYDDMILYLKGQRAKCSCVILVTLVDVVYFFSNTYKIAHGGVLVDPIGCHTVRCYRY